MKRRRTWVIVSIIIAAVVAALITTELIARSAVSERLSAAVPQRDGVTVSLGAHPALLQLIGGAADLDVTVSDSALGSLASCAADLGDLQVSASSAGLAVVTDRTIRGIQLPVTILLVPESTTGGWVLRADSVSVAGISIPASRAATMLGGDGNAARMLQDGIPLGGDGAVAVARVTTGEGYLRVTVNVPLAERSEGAGGGPLLDCLTDESTGEGQR